jgi:UBX domain-containing protein 1
LFVDLNDKRNEEFKEPPKTLKAFSGEGYSLSSTTTTTSTTPVAKPASSGPVVVNPSLPTTTIQIRLADGQKLIGTFNHSHTIQDIRSFIENSHPSNFAYDLMTSFPQKLLGNETQTVSEAGLLNSVVIQKKK